MSKSAEAFRTISEVADELEVPKHVLRFWEAKFPQIRPMKRGGGRRYYRPEDMDLLRGIRHLLHAEGYTIKGVQKILREHGIDQVKAYAEKAALLQEAAPKGKRGRRSLKDGAVTASADITQLAPPAAAATTGTPATRSGRDAAGKGGRASRSQNDVITSLVAELENCRRLLLTSSAPVSASAELAHRAGVALTAAQSSASPDRPAERSRRRSAG